MQGRRTIPLLQAYDYPYDKPEEIEDIPNAYEWHRWQLRVGLTKAARSEKRTTTCDNR